MGNMQKSNQMLIFNFNLDQFASIKSSRENFASNQIIEQWIVKIIFTNMK